MRTDGQKNGYGEASRRSTKARNKLKNCENELSWPACENLSAFHRAVELIYEYISRGSSLWDTN
jgi:hypothetical protein